MEKMNGTSLNLEKRNIDKIIELFPEAVEEGKINFEILRAFLGDEVDESKEKYQFTWNGKANSIKLAQTPSSATLRPCKEKSKSWDTTENLYIEGDNLEVLKQLQKTYYGKINMIYIDPPYNTGNDFVYKDSFTNSLENYKEQTNQSASSNPETNGRYHTDWLNMMYPRLLLAKNLLSDDGVIFISIDDNEQTNLKKICDEIFGEFNCLGVLAVELSKTQGMKVAVAKEGAIVKNHEYILVYSKNGSYLGKKPLYDKTDAWDNHFNTVIELTDGEYVQYALSDYISRFNPEIVDIFKKYGMFENGKISPSDISIGITIDDKIKDYFYNTISKKTYQEMACSIKIPEETNDKLSTNKIVGYDGYILTKSSGGKLRQYRALYENLHVSDDYVSEFCRTTIRGALWKGFYSDMMNVAKEGELEYKNGKKPVRLLKQLMKWTNNQDMTVLDFFSGSASTAHAVMEMNAEDGGNRKFIMVQLPELIEEKEPAYKAGYKNICEIGEERIRRAGEQIKSEWEKEHPSDSLFTSDEKFNVDIGFKVFKLDSTNIVPWDSSKQYDEDNLFNLSDIFKNDRSKEDILYEIMLKYGVFDKEVSEVEVNGKTMYRVGKRSMIVCLEDNITSEDVKAIGELSPQTVIFKESGFVDDNAKINASYNLEKAGVEDIKCI